MAQNPAKLAAGLLLLIAVWITVYWWWEPADRKRATISFADAAPQAVVEPAGPGPSDASDAAAPGARPDAPPQTPPTRPSAATAPLTAEPARPAVRERMAVTPPSFVSYTIRPGDTFQSIAKDHYGNGNMASAIARANPFVDPRTLRPGRTILLPADPSNIQGRPAATEGKPVGETGVHVGGPDGALPAPASKPASAPAGARRHTVEPGDTLSEISKRYYGTSARARQIYEANRDKLRSEHDLKVGVELVIPDVGERESAGDSRTAGPGR